MAVVGGKHCPDESACPLLYAQAGGFIRAMLVEPEARGKSLGADLLKSVIASHRGKTWHVPAIFPEEFGRVFERAGFQREELSQWQMKLIL